MLEIPTLGWPNTPGNYQEIQQWSCDREDFCSWRKNEYQDIGAFSAVFFKWLVIPFLDWFLEWDATHLNEKRLERQPPSLKIRRRLLGSWFLLLRRCCWYHGYPSLWWFLDVPMGLQSLVNLCCGSSIPLLLVLDTRQQIDLWLLKSHMIIFLFMAKKPKTPSYCWVINWALSMFLDFQSLFNNVSPRYLRRATAISQRLRPGGCAAGNLHLYTKIDQLPCHVGSSLEGLEPWGILAQLILEVEHLSVASISHMSMYNTY